MNKLPIPLPNNGFGRRDTGHIFEGSADNQLIMACMSRSLSKKAEAKHEANQKKMKEARINPEIILKWLEALKNGKYKQEKRFLKGRGDYFSVVGVLLDITKDITGGKWNGAWFIPSNERFTKGRNQDNYYMPLFVAEKLGCNRFDINCLSLLNEQGTFEELAEIIKTKRL